MDLLVITLAIRVAVEENARNKVICPRDLYRNKLVLFYFEPSQI